MDPLFDCPIWRSSHLKRSYGQVLAEVVVGFGVGYLVARLSEASGQFAGRLMPFISCHPDESLRHRMDHAFAGMTGPADEPITQPLQLQPDVELTSMDGQLLACLLGTVPTMQHPYSPAEKRAVVRQSLGSFLPDTTMHK